MNFHFFPVFSLKKKQQIIVTYLLKLKVFPPNNIICQKFSDVAVNLEPIVTKKNFVFIQGWGFHWLEIQFHLFLFGIRVWSDSAQIAEQQQKPNSCRVWAKKNSETSHERLFLALFDFLFCFTHYFECLRSTKVNARKLFFFFSKAKQKRKLGKNLW